MRRRDGENNVTMSATNFGQWDNLRLSYCHASTTETRTSVLWTFNLLCNLAHYSSNSSKLFSNKIIFYCHKNKYRAFKGVHLTLLSLRVRPIQLLLACCSERQLALSFMWTNLKQIEHTIRCLVLSYSIMDADRWRWLNNTFKLVNVGKKTDGWQW